MTGPNPTDRGKPGAKIHLLADHNRLPLAAAISAANTADIAALAPLVHAIPAVRSRPGPRRRHPGKLHADKAYDSAQVRRFLTDRGIPHASPAAVSNHATDSAHTSGPSNAPSPGSATTDASTDATNAHPEPSPHSPPSPAPSSATAASPNETPSNHQQEKPPHPPGRRSHSDQYLIEIEVVRIRSVLCLDIP